jgi:hypothetical protein
MAVNRALKFLGSPEQGLFYHFCSLSHCLYSPTESLKRNLKNPRELDPCDFEASLPRPAKLRATLH